MSFYFLLPFCLSTTARVDDKCERVCCIASFLMGVWLDVGLSKIGKAKRNNGSLDFDPMLDRPYWCRGKKGGR